MCSVLLVSAVTQPSLFPEESADGEEVAAALRLLEPLVEKIGRAQPALPGGAYGDQVASGVVRQSAPLPKGAPELLEAYHQAPWLRAVSHKIAFAVSAVTWRLYARKGARASGKAFVEDKSLARATNVERSTAIEQGLADGSLVEITSHPFLDLFDRPNPRMTGRAARQAGQVHLDLVGETYLVLDKNDLGMPTGMWPIPPTWVTDLPTADAPTYTVTFGGDTFRVPVTHVIPIRDLNPADPWRRGAGVGEALRDELDADEYAAKHVASWFHNSAMPDMIIALKGAKQDVVERAKRTWDSKLRGFAKKYQTHWTGAEIDVKRLDTSFKDMALIEIRKFERDTIIQTWGVPPEVLGIIENSNRATIAGADYLFAKHVLVPRLELWRGDLQMQLLPLFDERLILSYDSPIPADEDAQRTTLVALPQFATIDEVRARQGLTPLPEGKGQGFLVPAGVSYVDDLANLRVNALQAFHLQAGIPTVNEVRVRAGLPERPDGDVPTSGLALPPGFGAPSAPKEPPPEEPEPKGPADPTGGDDLLDDVGEEPPAANDNQAAGFSARARREAKRWRRKDLTEGNLEQVLNAVDVESMRRTLEPVISDLLKQWGDETIRQIDDSLRFDDEDPAVQDHLRELAHDRIGRLINQTTRNQLRDTLEQALAEGETRAEITARVREVFKRADQERADVIAQTESLRSSQFATQTAFVQSDADMKREWISTHDNRAREAHLAMDGQLRDLDEPFEVPVGEYTGAKAMQPGAFGIGALDIKCRCVLGAQLQDEDDGKAGKGARWKLVGGPVALKGRGQKASERARRELWKAADEKLQRWDERIARGCVRGFADQERRVLDVLDTLLS